MKKKSGLRTIFITALAAILVASGMSGCASCGKCKGGGGGGKKGAGKKNNDNDENDALNDINDQINDIAKKAQDDRDALAKQLQDAINQQNLLNPGAQVNPLQVGDPNALGAGVQNPGVGNPGTGGAPGTGTGSPVGAPVVTGNDPTAAPQGRGVAETSRLRLLLRSSLDTSTHGAGQPNDRSPAGESRRPVAD